MPDTFTGKYEQIGQEIGALVDRKNGSYGDSFANIGEILTILYPHGIFPNQYVDMAGVVRVIDKLSRIAHDHLADSWGDIAGYGLLGERRARGG